ncbi:MULTISPECIES: thiolase family protein [Protofrankia]|uniref:propanoyl-CoA C-acyltransferase n=1 Tax=Protofrankia coriariae TaxID=1562887 RepID=A0ABR5F6K9_9ACTN|nr:MULTISPECIES: thiolase family protein [Protofrankia]KLL12356.1 thiolase [Protofrankia coriariae]ONH37335.1 thiolase [Protofrankia sp. BMG5.30]
MGKVRIIGVGMIRFGRDVHRGERAMVEEVVDLALKDAGITASDVQRVFSGNAAAGLVSGQEMIRGQVALQGTDLAGVPLVNVENACASSSSAANLAFEAILSGRCDVALVIGVEKLSHTERSRAFDALQGATDVSAVSPATDGPATNSVFVDVYAQEARKYLAEYGATVADLAAVAVKNRRHASLNPLAQFQKPQTVEEVLAGRVIVDPLTLPMCSPTTDGAAAVVLCSDSYAQRLDRAGCEIRATRLAAGAGPGSQPVAVAVGAAFDDAGLGPDDLDVLELHDAAAPAEILQYADIGLCAPGEGHLLVRSGATAIGGRLPVNVSGGLLSRGHPIGATGCAQLVEIYDQLTGRAGGRQVEGARVGMAVNAGGWLAGTYAAAVATILEKAA